MAGTGKSFQDRELASKVRTLCLNEIKAIFEYKPVELGLATPEIAEVAKEMDAHMADMKKQLILKMSTSILPRLNEITGEDGGAIKIEGVEIKVR